MAKGKLILVCQYGGEFVKNDDSTLSYNGGEANAVNINHETLFDDLKLKLAEMCNLEYRTVSIKYFLPGNKKNLITLKNEKDLKRMVEFHGNSVTAEVFVMGKEGFDRDALKLLAIRESDVRPAETVNRLVSPKTAANPVVLHTVPTPSITPFTPGESVMAIDVTVLSPSRDTSASTPSSDHDADDDSDYAPRSIVAAATTDSATGIELTGSPAYTVKKRRQTASWKIGANGPRIVAVADNAGRRKSRKRSTRSQNIAAVADDMEQIRAIVPIKDYFDSPSTIALSDDDSLEKLVASWKDGITGVGQEFRSVKEFRDTLQKYAIAHRFVYKLKKNDTNRASGICVVEGCSWRIHASWVPADQSFTIKKLNNLHTCGGESWKSAHPTKNWLVTIIKDKLRESPHHKPKEIANSIFQDFGIELNYTQVWRGMEDAREQLQGSYKEAYKQLPYLCEKVLETNPGSFTKLVTNDDKRFQRLFISFHASIHGFQNGCRPLLFLESTFLKSKYQEILLAATAIDGDDGFFPVAFAIVDVENDDNWHWFLEQLGSAVSTSQSITFVSDREKGLHKLVLEVFNNAHHGYSMYHLMENLKKNVKGPFHGDGKGSLPYNFVAAAHAIRFAGFKKFTEQIKQVSSLAYDWVMQIEPEYWTSFSFKGERYNHITENVAESYTKLMEEVRESPIIQKIEALRLMMSKLFDNRRMDSSNWSTKLTPSKERQIQEENVKAHWLKVLISSDTLFEVHDDAIHVVNTKNWDCSCLGWKETGLPCRHAIAVFNSTGRSIYDYCSKYFTTDSFRTTYSESINPVIGIGKPLEKEEADSETAHVLPPIPSRPQSQQEEEEERTKTEVADKRTVTCSRCKEAGHNKVTCKATTL